MRQQGAEPGVDGEVVFRQGKEAGRIRISDFTDANALWVTITAGLSVTSSNTSGFPGRVLLAWRAQKRLCGCYIKITASGKSTKVITVAIARELAGFIRDIVRREMGTIKGLAAQGEERKQNNRVRTRRESEESLFSVYGHLGDPCY